MFRLRVARPIHILAGSHQSRLGPGNWPPDSRKKYLVITGSGIYQGLLGFGYYIIIAKPGAAKDGAGKVKKTIGFSYFSEEN